MTCLPLGLCLRFVIHDQNNNIVRPLLELLKETNQFIPDWLKYRKHEMSNPGDRRRNGNNFGGRDFRQNFNDPNRNNKRRGRGNGRPDARRQQQPSPRASSTDAW